MAVVELMHKSRKLKHFLTSFSNRYVTASRLQTGHKGQMLSLPANALKKYILHQTVVFLLFIFNMKYYYFAFAARFREDGKITPVCPLALLIEITVY